MGTQAPVPQPTTTVMGTPGPRDEKRPPHPAGRGNSSSGKTAFLHSIPLKRWLPSSNHAGAAYPPQSPRCKARAGNSPHRHPLWPGNTVSKAMFFREKSVFKNTIQTIRIKQALSKPTGPWNWDYP